MEDVGVVLKEIRKNKRKAYFVSAAIKVLEREGLDGFSARKVADETGYNVASIYTYFKNLDHLENLASIKFTNNYVNELTKTTKKLRNPLSVYLNMWIVFSKHAFEHPHYFYNVFFEPVSQAGDLNLFKEYYTMFPDEKPEGSIMLRMIEMGKTLEREAYVMNLCVKDGAISEEHACFVQEIHMFYFKSVLSDIVKDHLYKASVDLFQKLMVNFVYVLYHYVDEKYTETLEKFLDFYSVERGSYENFFEQKEIINI